MTPSTTEPRGRGTILNALRVALRIISGKDIFICSSETPAGVSELLFSREGSWRETAAAALVSCGNSRAAGKVSACCRRAEPSQALPRQLPRRGSQAITFVAKVLGAMRKLPAVLLALPLGELSPQVTERAHAVAFSAKVSSAIRNFPVAPKLPLRGSWHAVRRD